ncbi:MAG: hypothetical protein IKF14_07800 [Atopobiaceae bacterium]|nr:hypothetical protein [Atopobiaceae bacterium]
MDIQAAATQLINYLSKNPELIAQFAKHPYSTTATATGTDEKISKDDMSQIMTQVAAQSSGQHLGSNDIASAAANLLGQSGGSVHTLASSLFGGASTAGNAGATPSMADILAKSVIGGVAARGFASILTSALGTNKK